ncbi:DUF702 domain-containing protein [Paraglaciecola sp.]|uniref:DUF702 domain-containing protein n=1 Tax=Paraglaciecola sp. TaxID=1920173 RepID=UPI0030F3AC1A
MANNYKCTHCNTGCNGNTYNCSYCGQGGWIVYTGDHDKAVRNAQAKQKAALEKSQKEQVEREKALKKAKDKDAKKNSKQLKTAPDAKTTAKSKTKKEEELSSGIAFLGFVAAGFTVFSQTNGNAVAAGIAACLAGYVCWKLYKLIVIAFLLVILIFLFSQ